MSDFTEPTLTHIADFSVDVGAPVVVGETAAGVRRVVPILGGRVSGKIEGVIEAGGADFQILRRDGTTELEARYVIRTGDGDAIYVNNRGLRHGPPAIMAALARGEAVDPSQVYFRAYPAFETGAADHKWLMHRLFVATGVRRPHSVELRIYELG